MSETTPLLVAQHTSYAALHPEGVNAGDGREQAAHTLSFSHIEYSVRASPEVAPNPLALSASQKLVRPVLKDVSGYARPGQLLAVLGGSGSGKTSLLDFIMGRVDKEHSRGTVRINERICTQEITRNFIGYVMQDDFLMPNLTVRETIYFLVMLRHSATSSREALEARVTSIMEQLELLHVAELRIGGKFTRGLSGGQRRRVTIGTQLLMDPTVLLCDEPTSGLDSTTAFHIVENLRALARRGRTVMITIHQPSSEMFPLFDRILLLSRGKVAYFGDGMDALSHFGALGHNCPPFTNPLDFLIDISSIDTRSEESELRSSKQVARLVEGYEQSKACSQTQEFIAEIGSATSGDHSFESPVKLGFLKTVKILMHRLLLNLWRSPGGLNIRALQYVLFSFLLWAFMGRFSYDQNSIQNRIGYFYESLAGGTFMGMFSGTGLFPDIRDIYYREKRDALYSPVAFVVSYTLHAIPTDVIAVLLFTLFSYVFVGIAAGPFSFGVFFTVCFLGMHFGESLSLMCLSIFQSTNVAQNATSLILSAELLLASGMLRSVQSMPTWLVSLGYACIPKFISEALAYSQFRDIDFDCSPMVPCPYANGQEYLDANYPNAADNFVRDMLAGTGMVILARVLFLVLLYFKR
eukprot:m.123320 g.123320  ORF g.123320 m.123320 type:complete len:637 (-) comp52155_c0_seq4:72-1982(-)